MSAFKAYDIRGIYNKDFDKNTAYKVGYFLKTLLNCDKVLVGYDTRLSSLEIFESLSKGICDSGIDCYNMGLSTTPMVYYATATYGFIASVQITASHNSKEYNGLKISTKGAMPIGVDTGLLELERLVSFEKITVSEKFGKIIGFDIKDEYIKFMRGKINDNKNLKIAMDLSNGMAAIIAKQVFGNDVEYIFDNLDGNFPNHEPNPLIEENCKFIKQKVLEIKADIGVIFDGDADRAMFIDENGRFISPDLIIAVVAHYFKDYKGSFVLHDIRTSKSVSEYLKKQGFVPYMWKVGHSFAKLKMKEIDAIFGGELAGHYYFKDFFSCDSGFMVAIYVLNVVSQLKKEGKKLSQLIDEIVKYSFSGEINFIIENKKEAVSNVLNYFKNNEKIVKIYDFDGIRIEFENYWFSIRVSNTEPYLRLVLEADNENLLNEKINLIKKILNV